MIVAHERWRPGKRGYRETVTDPRTGYGLDLKWWHTGEGSGTMRMTLRMIGPKGGERGLICFKSEDMVVKVIDICEQALKLVRPDDERLIAALVGGTEDEA